MVSKNIYTRFSIFWGIKGMLSLFQEYVDALKNAEGHYELWRDRFMKAGLLLGIAIASACIVTFSLLVFIQNPITPIFLLKWFVSSGISLVAAILIFILLNVSSSSHLTSIFFLSFSWSITLLPQLFVPFYEVDKPIFVSWVLVFLSQATLIPFRWRLHLLSQVVPFVYCLVLQILIDRYSLGSMVGLESAGLYLFMFWVCCICNISVFMFEKLAYAEFLSLQQLNLEQKKSDQLLLNILPPAIASQLKEKQKTIAETYKEVTILFADIVGFTQLSSQISAPELVELLNTIFSRFDRLAEKYGVEKIKTIGDAYMVVAGLPQPREDHAVAIASMALEMQIALSQYNQHYHHSLNLRIGIHTGEVVAGVIGLKKFAYDLWGDTVNTASRMESHSIPGKIQVSELTYHYLKDKYQLEKRGQVTVKGKGDMETYFLLGELS